MKFIKIAPLFKKLSYSYNSANVGGGEMVTALSVSNNFIKRAESDNEKITPMKLQKLLYFLYARMLFKYDLKLFDETFETWKYGPVIPEVYYYFARYNNKPIGDYYYGSGGKAYFTRSESNIFEDAFEEIWNEFKSKSGWDLSDLTHGLGAIKDTAWTKARDLKNPHLKDEDIKIDGGGFFEKE
ncbi:MAG: DUF4065 domain-containing protein [Defluviitaleaceae bacterium]|nr:DUF4065 domain-containing protein [Defluviitaleaceae bacterium]